MRKRDASNIALLLADEEETVSGFDAVGLGAPRGHQHSRRPPQQRFPRAGDKVVKKEGTGPGARGYQGIVYAITFARELRRRGATCSQRVDALLQLQGRRRVAVADAGRVQRVDRRRGGHLRPAALRARLHDGAARHGRRPRKLARRGQRDWTSARGTARHVDHGWLTDGARQLRSGARCVVVVEKEGVFQRLVEDNFYDDAYPCVLVTAMGVPDLATRAFVHRLRATLGLPVYGLVDWNSWGVGVLLTYKLGSARLGVESHRGIRSTSRGSASGPRRSTASTSRTSACSR